MASSQVLSYVARTVAEMISGQYYAHTSKARLGHSAVHDILKPLCCRIPNMSNVGVEGLWHRVERLSDTFVVIVGKSDPQSRERMIENFKARH